MNWNVAQVAEKLGSSKMFVKGLVRRGVLTPVNERIPGAAKFYAKFDSAQVNALVRSGQIKPLLGARKRVRFDTAVAQGAPTFVAPPVTSPVVGIFSRLDAIERGLARLDEIERKMDLLLAVWS